MDNYFGSEQLLELYKLGLFPMAKGRNSLEIEIIDPLFRGILPIKNFHIPKRLNRFYKSSNYSITCNKDFRQTIVSCASLSSKRTETWINNSIINLYCDLHQNGHAHSIEVWDDKILIGGLYGISMGSAFFGESMFSIKTNASKLALIKLVEALDFAGYSLLDAQFHNPHLEQFGLIEISRQDFLVLLLNSQKQNLVFPQEYINSI